MARDGTREVEAAVDNTGIDAAFASFQEEIREAGRSNLKPVPPKPTRQPTPTLEDHLFVKMKEFRQKMGLDDGEKSPRF